MNNNTPRIAKISLYLGIISAFLLIISILIGIFVESIGIVSFFGTITFVAAASIICGLIDRKKIIDEKTSGKQTAKIGILLGVIIIGLIFILRISIFIFFIPWLGN